LAADHARRPSDRLTAVPAEITFGPRQNGDAQQGQARHHRAVHLCVSRAAEQIMAMPAVHRRWTASEVRALVDANELSTPRYELVDGELLVTPAPRLFHQAAVSSLIVLLHGYLAAEPVGRVLASPSDVELEPEFLSQPDLFVVPRDEWRRVRSERIVRSLT